MANGATTTTIPASSTIDEAIGNKSGASVRIAADSLAAQVVASTAMAAKLTSLKGEVLPGPNENYVTDDQLAALAAGGAGGNYSFATIAALNAYVAPPAGVRVRVMEDNGEYEKVGAAGVGPWVRVGNWPDKSDANITRYAARRPLNPRKICSTGTGASFYNGTTTVGADSTSGGVFIPAGSTGAGSTWQALYKYDLAVSEARAGITYRYTITLATSPEVVNELTSGSTLALSMLFTENSTGNTGDVANYRFQRQSEKVVTYEVDYEFFGDEVQLQQWFSITGSNAAVAADTHLTIIKCDEMRLDSDSQGEVIEYLAAPMPDKLLPVTLRRNSLQPDVVRIHDGWGMLIPAGTKGLNSILRDGLPVFDIPPGTEIQVTYNYETSAGFATETPMTYAATRYLTDPTLPGLGINAGASLTKISDTAYQGVIRYTVEADCYSVELAVLPNGGSAQVRTTDGRIQLVGVSLEVTKATPGKISEIVANYREAVQAWMARRPNSIGEVVTAGPNGIEDHTSIRAAVAAAGRGAAPQRPKLVKVSPGIYAAEISETQDIWPRDFVNVESVRGPDETIIMALFPAGTPNQDKYEGVLWDKSCDLRGLKVAVRNARYACHAEAGGNPIFLDALMEDCWLEHLGADGWASPSAFGCGMHGGEHLRLRRTTMLSPTQALGFHDNIDMLNPCHMDVGGCTMFAHNDGGDAIGVSCIGSGVMSKATFDGCSINGLVTQRTANWLSPRIQPANRFSYRMFFKNCAPVSWYADNDVDCLEIRSIGGANTNVQLSEAGATLLFGTAPHVIAGGVGYGARIYSQWAISKEGISPTVPVSLAEKLGDCSLVPKYLGVRFDNAETYVLELDQNFTGQTNQAIVDWLNGALAAEMPQGTGGRAFYVSRPYTDRAPIFQIDRERYAKNRHSAPIAKETVLAWSGGWGGVEPMTAAHSAADFAGVALNDALIGGDVRLLGSGAVNQRNVSLSGGISLGDTFEIGPTPGAIVQGSTRPIFKAVTGTAGLATLEFLQAA